MILHGQHRAGAPVHKHSVCALPISIVNMHRSGLARPIDSTSTSNGPKSLTAS